MQCISFVAAVADPGFLGRLRSLIACQQEIRLLVETSNAAQTLRAIGDLHPAVLLADTKCLHDGSVDDSTVLAAIHRISPVTKTILLTEACSTASLVEAMRLGARGRMSRTASPDDCLRAVRAVCDGEVWIARRSLAVLLDALVAQSNAGPAGSAAAAANGLSRRESEIVAAVKLGLTNKEIARKLRISDATVKTHLERIFHKLKISRRVQVAAVAASVLEPASAPGAG